MNQHRPSRINPDTLPVLIVAVVTAAGLGVASFLLSYAALDDVASWAAVPAWLTWAVPVMLDAAIVVYTLAVLVHRARRESAAGAWWTLTLWTTVSVAANAAHAAGVPDEWQRAVGTVVAALAPIAVLLATHTIADLIVARTDADTEAASAEDRTDTADAADDGERADTTPDTTPDEADAPADTKTDTGTPSGPTPAAAPSAVRRHTSSHPRKQVRPGGRVSEHRDEILRMAADGKSGYVIADALGLGKTAVYDLLKRETALTA